MKIMTNIAGGSFSLGPSFQVHSHNDGSAFPNNIDTPGYFPMMWPPTPGPGLRWGLTNFPLYGVVTVTNSPYVWNGSPGIVWTTNTGNLNWQNAIGDYVDNAGATFDESASGAGP